MRRLFDSIWRGFPIGTLLLWSRPGGRETLRFGPVTIDADATEDAYWVVDGQQRVTTLIAALTESPDVDPLFDVCFDLRRARFVHAGKRPTPTWWLPLRVTLESRTLLSWLRENADSLEPHELDLADELAGALRDYRILGYLVEHDDEQLLRDVFDRVNSAGKPISRAQVFHALFGGDTELASAGAVIASLRHEGFGDFDDQRVVQSLLAIRGGDVARDLHLEFEPKEDRAGWFDDTERALSRVIRFLRGQGVPHLQLVPSLFPIPVLAAFFHLHPDPDAWTERLLARWVWRGWVHGYGRSGQTPALRQAVRAVNPLRGDPSSAPTAYSAVEVLLRSVQADPPSTVNVLGFRTDSASGRLALLALVDLGPKRPDSAPIDIADAVSRFGVDAVTELVPNHRANLAARGFWPRDIAPPSGVEAPDVLRSHAIDREAAAALVQGDQYAFLDHRAELLRQYTTTYLATRVESGALVRPPIGELFVDDDDLLVEQ